MRREEGEGEEGDDDEDDSATEKEKSRARTTGASEEKIERRTGKQIVKTEIVNDNVQLIENRIKAKLFVPLSFICFCRDRPSACLYDTISRSAALSLLRSLPLSPLPLSLSFFLALQFSNGP